MTQKGHFEINWLLVKLLLDNIVIERLGFSLSKCFNTPTWKFSELELKKMLSFILVNQKKKIRCLPCALSLSTCSLLFFSWLLDHVIYLKLGKKKSIGKTEQIHKMTCIFTQNNNFLHHDHFERQKKFCYPLINCRKGDAHIILETYDSRIVSFILFSAWDRSPHWPILSWNVS